MKIRTLVLAFGAAAVATPGFSAPACSDGSDYEIGQCLAKELKKAEIDLTYAYAKALDATQMGESVTGATDATQKAKLEASQRAFLAYRKAQCDGLVGEMWSGGSGQGIAIESCELEMTQARIKQLMDIQ